MEDEDDEPAAALAAEEAFIVPRQASPRRTPAGSHHAEDQPALTQNVRRPSIYSRGV